jgi:polysaccharide pyruvyl transferase WcaK-like protein
LCAIGGRRDHELSPRIGLWGTADVANFGDLLFPRIFELEMKRRLPGAGIRFFSPTGARVGMDPGLATEALGPSSIGRAAELAGQLDLVVVGGGDIVHFRDDVYDDWYDRNGDPRLRPSDYVVGGLGLELERICPVAWHAVGVPYDLDGADGELTRIALRERRYVSVRDEISHERLRRLGVQRKIHVVPDSGLLLDRLYHSDELAERRTRDGYPAEGRPLVVQGSRALLPLADEIAAALSAFRAEDGRDVVLLVTGPCHGDDAFAAAIAERLPWAHRLSSEPAVGDVVAAIEGASAFVGSSLHGAITALVYRVPWLILNLGLSKLDGFAELVGLPEAVVHSPSDLLGALRRIDRAPRPDLTRLVADVDSHFDRLAALALEATSTSARLATPEPVA